MIKVTVFTPTYNRAEHIPNLYRSLCAQTVKDFEWLVIDQGTDGTEALVRGFQAEAPFPVVYHRLEGERGISRAINRMTDLAHGALVFRADDDDQLTPDAVEAVLGMASTLTDRTDYAGVSGVKMYPDGRAIGGEWQLASDWIDCTNLEREKYGLMGDKAEAYFLDVLREFGPMPTVPGEYYTWEGILWDRIAHAGRKIRWFNQKIYIAEYLPGGATDTSAAAKLSNLRTYTLFVSERMVYRELPLLTRFKLCCRYFELVRQKGWRYADVKDAFSRCRLMAWTAYLASAVTRHIGQEPVKP